MLGHRGPKSTDRPRDRKARGDQTPTPQQGPTNPQTPVSVLCSQLNRRGFTSIAQDTYYEENIQHGSFTDNGLVPLVPGEGSGPTIDQSLRDGDQRFGDGPNHEEADGGLAPPGQPPATAQPAL